MRVRLIVLLSLGLCSMASGQDSLNVTRVGVINSGTYLQFETLVAYGNHVLYSGLSSCGMIDATDLHHPMVQVDSIDIGFEARLLIRDTLAYVGGWNGALDETGDLHILDLSDPAAPVEIGATHGFYSLANLAYRNGLLYATDHWEGFMHIFDVTNPVLPVQVGTCDLYYDASGAFEIVDTLAFLSTVHGIRILSMAAPMAPYEVTSLLDTLRVWDLAISNNHLCALTRGTIGLDSLRVFDISNPVLPQPAGVLAMQAGRALAADGDRVYVATYQEGLRVVDISDPLTPSEVGHYSSSRIASDVYVQDSLIYVAEGDWFSVYRYAPPLSSAAPYHPSSFILSAYPNPFNYATQIRFDLPRASFVELNVYDVTGRLVENLASRMYQAGSHSVAFDGSNRASGMYVVKMESGQYSTAQQVILVK
jgi:hypothetical protein